MSIYAPSIENLNKNLEEIGKIFVLCGGVVGLSNIVVVAFFYYISLLLSMY